MDFKFNKGDTVKFIGSDYLGLKNKLLIIDEDGFSLYHTPTYKVHPKEEPWKSYIFYENLLKRSRGK